jgi:hypothetical protein
MKSILADRTTPNSGGWQDRHDSAVAYPRGFEAALVSMLTGWRNYAQRHYERYDMPIGDDGVLGPEWRAIGEALLGLLNGDCGRLDCGHARRFHPRHDESQQRLD